MIGAFFLLGLACGCGGLLIARWRGVPGWWVAAAALAMLGALVVKTVSSPHCGDCELAGDTQNRFALATAINAIGWMIGALLAGVIGVLTGRTGG
jgi:hypothetical protein